MSALQVIDAILSGRRVDVGIADIEKARAELVELIAELDKAHKIIGIALNCLHGEAKRKFVQRVCDAGLDGDGVTRANERAALLARAVGAP